MHQVKVSPAQRRGATCCRLQNASQLGCTPDAPRSEHVGDRGLGKQAQLLRSDAQGKQLVRGVIALPLLLLCAHSAVSRASAAERAGSEPGQARVATMSQQDAEAGRKRSIEHAVSSIGSRVADGVNSLLRVDAGIWAAFISSMVALYGYRAQRLNARASKLMETQKETASIKSSERSAAEANARTLKTPLLFFVCELCDELTQGLLSGRTLADQPVLAQDHHFLYTVWLLGCLFTWIDIAQNEIPTLGLELERAGVTLDVRLLRRANAIRLAFKQESPMLFQLRSSDQRALSEAMKTRADYSTASDRTLPFIQFVERFNDPDDYMSKWTAPLVSDLLEFHRNYQEDAPTNLRMLSRLGVVHYHLLGIIDAIDPRYIIVPSNRRRSFPLEKFGLSPEDVQEERYSPSQKQSQKSKNAQIPRKWEQVAATSMWIKALVNTLRSTMLQQKTNQPSNVANDGKPPRQFGRVGVYKNNIVQFQLASS